MTTHALRLALALMLAASAFASASAETSVPAAPAAKADPVMEARKTAFLALPEADRKQAQDALSWLGLYNGVVDGGFGKRTHDAILAYQTTLKASGDGVLTPTQLAALKVAGQKARDAVGFQIVADAKSGMSFGAPLKILVKRSADGARLMKADGSVTLDLHTASGADADLAALYARLSAESTGRKVTYKAIKPDTFFVVTGMDGARDFYTRYAKGSGPGQELRGFTFSYPPAQAATFERIALAIGDSFEPFPTNEPVASAEAKPPAPQADAPKPAPAGPILIATALTVAPGQALSAIRADDCPAPTIGGKPAKILRSDASTGLVLFEGDFAPAPAPGEGALGPDLVVLSVIGAGEGKRPTLSASAADMPSPQPAHPLLIAPLEQTASGAPVFDRRGRLAAMIAPIGEEPKHFAAVAIASPHAIISGEAIKAFLGGGFAATGSSSSASAGEIAAAKRAAIHAVYCVK